MTQIKSAIWYLYSYICLYLYIYIYIYIIYVCLILVRLGNAPNPVGWRLLYVIFRLPFGNQTWLAGKSPINGSCYGIYKGRSFIAIQGYTGCGRRKSRPTSMLGILMRRRSWSSLPLWVSFVTPPLVWVSSGSVTCATWSFLKMPISAETRCFAWNWGIEKNTIRKRMCSVSKAMEVTGRQMQPKLRFKCAQLAWQNACWASKKVMPVPTNQCWLPSLWLARPNRKEEVWQRLFVVNVARWRIKQRSLLRCPVKSMWPAMAPRGRKCWQGSALVTTKRPSVMLSKMVPEQFWTLLTQAREAPKTLRPNTILRHLSGR